MPGFLGGSGGGGGGTGGEIIFPKEFVDPVTKLRVSNPENLIDTDFEYGLQPTKWETVELINNTPSFFSKSGDTTIDGIISMTTNSGTREITVETALDHQLAVGIPINVTGTKSLTADGSFIIASIPNSTTFTYLCKANQQETLSINDLYTSIITGEFFQGSQIGIDDSEGILTDGESISTLTVKTRSTHGFGEKTPLYFLNINSTISQDFQAANTATRSFDASNSATAQSFDGSNSLSTVSIDLTNSGVESSIASTVSAVSTTENTITVTHGSENFLGFALGAPLYYDVSSGSGYFNTNPRGVVFLKTVDNLGESSSTFTVSDTPDGDTISIEAGVSGTFQLSDLSRTFAGNNVNPETQTEIQVVVGDQFVFDGGNQGFDGVPVEGETGPDNSSTVVGYTGDSITITGSESLDYYVGAMIFYSSTGSSAANLANNTTYFVTSFNPGGVTGLFTMTITDLPGNDNISNISGGTGTQTFEKIGISLDRNIVHVKDSLFLKGDMLEYTPPTSEGNFSADFEKKFYYVAEAYDEHNYALKGALFRPIVATGGNVITETFEAGRYYRIHQFLSTGSQNFVVEKSGTEGEVEYLIVGGGGGGGADMGGGGGGGGVLEGNSTVSAGTYPIVVGAGGLSSGQPYSSRNSNSRGQSGANSTAFGVTALGGGGGAGIHDNNNAPALSGFASGGGASGRNANWAPGTAGQGNRGGTTGGSWYAGGGGGAGAVGSNGRGGSGAFGGNGKPSSILGTTYWFGGGGGASGYSASAGFGGRGGGGGGGRWSAGVNGAGGLDGLNPGGGGTGSTTSGRGGSGGANTGGGAGGHAHQAAANFRSGGSGIVVVRYPITDVVQSIVSATGGTLSVIEDEGILYAVHQFTSVGTTTFEIQRIGDEETNNIIEYMVIGGGGSGGSDMGGGGGAGGYLAGTFAAAAATYTVVVGAGGSGNNSGVGNRRGFEGGSSSLVGGGTNLVAFGGGGGASNHDRGTNPAGGLNNGVTVGSGGGCSGGGGNAQTNAAISGTYGGSRRGTGTVGQGNDGGTGSGTWYPGGGGGAGGPGQSNPGHGGPGVANAILGPNYYWAGGGGGSGYSSTTGNGGIGGGGSGAGRTVASGGGSALNNGSFQTLSGSGQRNIPGANAGANTGSGGGGGSHYSSNNFGGAGGSGIVVIRYPIGTVQ